MCQGEALIAFLFSPITTASKLLPFESYNRARNEFSLGFNSDSVVAIWGRSIEFELGTMSSTTTSTSTAASSTSSSDDSRSMSPGGQGNLYLFTFLSTLLVRLSLCPASKVTYANHYLGSLGDLLLYSWKVFCSEEEVPAETGRGSCFRCYPCSSNAGLAQEAI